MSESVPLSLLQDVRRLEGLPDNLMPKVPLTVGGMVTMDGETYVVERRVGHKWQLLSFEHEPLFIDDASLYAKMSAGSCHAHSDSAMAERSPLTPLLVSEKAAAKNAKKFAFVQACKGLPRSRLALESKIKDTADQLGISAPGFTTVLGWIDLHEAYPGIGTASLSDRDDCKGRRGGRLPPWQEEAIDAGIKRWLTPGETMSSAYAAVTAAVAAYEKQSVSYLDRYKLKPHQLDANGRLAPPCQRTFERRCRAVDPMQRDLRKMGLSFVKQRYSTWQTRGIPDRPYAEVECDHCTLDIQIVDPSGMIFGRPDLIVFLDRATKMVLGYSIGFDAPSYASFVKGLESVYFSKDLSKFPKVQNPWPCVGSIETLYVDNAFHFIGKDIQEAGRELQFNTTILPPREPWLKGSVERFFGTFNSNAVHRMAGTTLSSVAKRRNVETLTQPKLTLQAFEALLVSWICDIYHAQPHRGLGFVPGASDIPLRVWAEKHDVHRAPKPPSRELFMSLAGERETRVIGRQGIEWDRIKYQSPVLMELKAHPDHKTIKGSSTRYKVVRDPSNIGSISVIDHHTNRVLKVPAAHAFATYAEGTSVHQHKVCLARAREAVGAEVDLAALRRAREQMSEAIHSIVEQDSFKKTHRKLARFIGENARRSDLSEPLFFAPPSTPATGFQSFAPVDRIAEEPSWDTRRAGRDRAERVEHVPSVALPVGDFDDDDDDFAQFLKTQNVGGGYDR